MFFMFEDLVDAPPPVTAPIDFLGLPGFAEAKAHLEERGFPSAWITDVVDPTEKHAFFNKNGRPWYKSQCMHYAGYWLHGGTGSVQCRACESLLPGLMWDTTCSKKFEDCPFYRTGGADDGA